MAHQLIGEEAIASDTDISDEFATGIRQGHLPGMRPNQNQNVFIKPREKTLAERAHVGSAAWTDSQDQVREFAAGVADDRRGEYAHRINDGLHHARPAHNKVVG